MLVFKYTTRLGVLLLGAALVVFMELPKSILPIVTLCPPAGGFCTSTYNPIYPVAFIASIIGAVLIFWGRTDRAFIFSSSFVAGMLLATFGWGGIVLGYLGHESCIQHPIGLGCMAYNPELFEPLILLAASLISLSGYSWHVASNTESRLAGRRRARFLGWVSSFFGLIVFLFGLTVVASLADVSVGDQILWLYWAQVVGGLVLMAAGSLSIVRHHQVEVSRGPPL